MLIGNNSSTDGTYRLEQFKNIKIINLNENRGINPILLRLQHKQRSILMDSWDDDFLVKNILIYFKNIISNNLKHSYFLSGKVIFSIRLAEKEKISRKDNFK